jgi:NAD(P)H-nitrite reductase large subunit
MRLRSNNCLQEHGIEVLTGTKVIGLNPEARVVKLSSGSELKYDAVFIGTGSE